ncbi:MAG TPA: FG-GAP-like repeat-containing protein [Streptosporangiaceae bacterium]
MIADIYNHHTTVPADAAGGASTAGVKFGAAVAVGDFNKDGKADVAVGAPNDAVGGVAAGAVSVFLGTARGIGSGVRLTQSNVSGASNEAGDKFGASLATGDFNGDGFADLAVGAPGEAVGSASGSGGLAVFPGSASGLSAGTGFNQSIGGGVDEAGDGFATTLTAGDFNGDGFADLAIGVPGEAPASGSVHGGAVYVYKGSASGVVRGWAVTQEDAGGTTESGDRFGSALAAGNVTGSANADLVVGAPGEAPGSAPAGAGMVYVVPGASTGKSAGFGRVQGDAGGTSEANDHFGAALAVGNFDKDGFADIVVGVPDEAPGSDPAGGDIAVFPGASAQTAAAYWVHEVNAGEAITAGDKYGSVLATGDANGDGYADLLVGAPGKTYGSATGAGAGFLYSGGPRDTGSTVSLKLGRRIAQPDAQWANGAGDAFGSGLAFGDTDGDGKREAVIGAPGETPPGQPASGAVVQLSKLAPGAAPSVPVEQYSPSTAVQASPLATGGLGTLEYAYTDNIGRLVHGHQSDPGNFSTVQWTVLSGLEAYSGAPSLAEQADGRLQVAAHNTSSNVWVNTQATKDPAAWGDWLNIGGAMASSTAVARQTDGTLVLFAIDGNGVLWASQQPAPNAAHTAWLSTGVTGLTGTPVAVTLTTGVEVFVRDTTGDVKTALWSDRMLTGCASLNGSGLAGTPAVVVLPGGRIWVFARAADGSIQAQENSTSGTFPGTWNTVGSFTATGSPSAVLSPASGRVELVARAGDGIIYSNGETAQGSGLWRDWVRAIPTDDATVSATDPTAFPYAIASGPTWSYVIRTSDQLTRLYTTDGGAAAAATDSKNGPPTFTGHALPAPPK